MSRSERSAAIVGIHEFPSRDVEGQLSPLQIKASCAVDWIGLEEGPRPVSHLITDDVDSLQIGQSVAAQ